MKFFTDLITHILERQITIIEELQGIGKQINNEAKLGSIKNTDRAHYTITHHQSISAS